MEITFLGTGADTSYPLIFCNCTNCTEARSLGGKNLRKRSSILINKDLLIDLGPDVVSSSFTHNIDLSRIKHLLITHPHSDHFDPAHLSTRLSEYAVENVIQMDVIASTKSIERMSHMMGAIGDITELSNIKAQERLKINVIPVDQQTSIKLGQYEVFPIRSYHDESIDSLFYVIRESTKNLLYGTDMKKFEEETWRKLENMNLKFDIVVLDHTYGPEIPGGSHMNASQVAEKVQELKNRNLLNTDARIFATHISHEGNPTHEKLSELAQQNDYKIAYDGLIVNS